MHRLLPSDYRPESVTPIHAIYAENELRTLSDAVPFLRWARIDAAECRSESAFLDDLARAMRFPSYFGRNWDAALDCLRDLPNVEPLLGHGLVVTGVVDSLRHQPSSIGTLIEIWPVASDFWRRQGTGLHLVLALSGRR
jgi:RNAse (barnase) inhibitor barstar